MIDNTANMLKEVGVPPIDPQPDYIIEGTSNVGRRGLWYADYFYYAC